MDKDENYAGMKWETITGIAGFIAVAWKNRKEILNVWEWVFHRKRKVSAAKRRKIDEMIAELGNWYRFNRVTIAEFCNWELRPTTLEDYGNMTVTVTNEWVRNAETVMDQFQNASCKDHAVGIMKLDKSTTGWLPIPPDEDPQDTDTANLINDLIDVQNLYSIVKSYRFKLGEHVTDGSMAVSFTHNGYKELTLQELREIRSVAREIYKLVKKQK